PIASDDVADAMADVALSAPANATLEIAVPERARLSELVARYLNAIKDPRTTEADVEARYFGGEKIEARGLEKFEHGLILEGRRVGEV
ncbi:NmrA family transcriptional regulator, partial [Rhizobium johnstonii]